MGAKSNFFRRVAWLPVVWMMAAMTMAPTAEAQGHGRLGTVGRMEPSMRTSARAMTSATATLTVNAVVVSSMQISLEQGNGDAMAEAAGSSSGRPGGIAVVVRQANDGSANYTLLAAMRPPRHDVEHGQDGVAFLQIEGVHANGHRQSLAESGVTFFGGAQGSSRDREAVALIAIPN
jgi:hypothetical protein